MNFEEFRHDLENKLKAIYRIELIEFHFQPLSFGSGVLAYRIEGKIHKFIFDGRDNQLSWLISQKHQNYVFENFSTIKIFDGLFQTSEKISGML